MARIYVFKRFERFWHWAQALLVIFMLVSGFEVHGTIDLLGFERAVDWHVISAWALIALWLFAIFWHFTTGEWRQYVPTTENLVAMMRYYMSGIFTDAPHPYRVTALHKHNPLQRLAYLGVKLAINPLLWVTGLLYLFYELWAGSGWLDLAMVAGLHAVGAWLMLLFLIVHLYLATAGQTPTAHLKAMITGWDDHPDKADQDDR